MELKRICARSRRNLGNDRQQLALPTWLFETSPFPSHHPGEA